MRRTFHLPRKPSAELPPVQALRRDPKPRRVGVIVRSGVVALGGRHGRGQTGLAISPSGSDGPYLDSIRLQRAEARELDGAVDDMGRTRRERAAWASVLRGFALALAVAACPLPALAVCSGHQTSITAGDGGSFRLCPREQAADGTPVCPAYYERCDVRVVWAGGGTSASMLAHPTPGVPVLVGFPAAHGAGGATATCTSADGQTSPLSASSIRWRELLPLPAGPVLEAP